MGGGVVVVVGAKSRRQAYATRRQSSARTPESTHVHTRCDFPCEYTTVFARGERDPVVCAVATVALTDAQILPSGRTESTGEITVHKTSRGT